MIEALAGTGKTSVLNMMADETPDEKVILVCYNKAIQMEATRKFGKHVDCRTAHSLAYRAIGAQYQDKLNGPRVTTKQAAAILGINTTFELDASTGLYLSPRKLAWLTSQTIQRFCYSGDMEVGRHHVPTVPGGEHAMEDLRTFITPFARKMWADIDWLKGRLRYLHDHYLKQFQIRIMEKNIKLPYDVWLFDEAQDSNPCTSSIVLSQDHAQLIAVGDRNQAIYGWRGAEDAMQTWPADVVLPLTQSFRFGPAIADEANKWLEMLDTELRVLGFDQVNSTVGLVENPNVVLCRTNAGAVDRALTAEEEGKRAAIVGGVADIRMFAEAARDLMAGEPTYHPELVAFKTWDQVMEYVQEGSGADLKVFVNLIDNYGVETVLRVCASNVKEEDADIILSTAHKAKGREWDKVMIGNDFKEPENLEEEAEINKYWRAEGMLAYVSVTRAKQQLNCEGLSWVNQVPEAEGARQQ